MYEKEILVFFDIRKTKLKGTQKLEAELTIRAGKIVWDLNGTFRTDLAGRSEEDEMICKTKSFTGSASERILGDLCNQHKSNYMRCIAIILISILLAQCNTKDKLPKGDPGNGGLILPGGFEAVVVADSTGPARHIAVNTNGDIYVKLSHSKKGEGGNLALRDTDNDGKADSIVRFGDYFNEGSLSNCMRIHNGYLYYASELIIYRKKLTPGKLVPDSESRNCVYR